MGQSDASLLGALSSAAERRVGDFDAQDFDRTLLLIKGPLKSFKKALKV